MNYHITNNILSFINVSVALLIMIISIQEAGKTGKKIKAIPGKPGIYIE